MKNRQIWLVAQPEGPLAESHFELREADAPEPGEGEVLVRTVLISLDAANRAWMQGPTYRSEMTAGNVMEGFAVGEVVESHDGALAPGDLVAGLLGWQDYSVHPARRLRRLPRDYRPVSHFLSLLGIAGKTAYHGLLQVGAPKQGETVLVSAAAGSVGAYVGQIARIKGCRTVGIAGGPDKCRWIVDQLGYDAAIDYKAEDVAARLGALCPDGVDVYFDNVGGRILQAALFNMAMHGRVVCCGAISQYDTTEMESPRGIPGVIVFKRLRLEGFIVSDFADKDAEAERDLAAWYADGKIEVVEDILDGLDAAPRALIGLLAGDNVGKRMVRVGPDPS
jgi:NADPH-dependent curcumin reductase CurA